MKSRPINLISLYVPDTAVDALSDYLDEVRCKRHIALIAGEAIREWIARARARAAETPDQAPQGYQWKGVFLPSGTRLKTQVRGRTYYAAVEGNQIQYDGKAVSPHVFANAFGVEGRNAWRDIWLHLPYESTWRPAISLKEIVRP